jgi:transcriptional regulator with XRE-family HTH domain
MNDTGERIREIRVLLKLKQGEFAKRLKISQGLLSGIEKGKEALSDRNLKLICMEFMVNRHWLLTGEGRMFDVPPAARQVFDENGNKLTPEETELIAVYRELSELNRKLVLRHAHFLKEEQDKTIPGPKNRDKSAEKSEKGEPQPHPVHGKDKA